MDVVVTVHNSDDLDSTLFPSHIMADLARAGYPVRSVTIIDLDTGLTATVRSDAIVRQDHVDREADR